MEIKHESFWNFPPPSFLSMPAAGINISDHSVKMIRFRNNDPENADAETVFLGGGAVVSGEVKKPKEIIRILSNLRRKYDMRYVRLSIPEEKGYIFNLTIPILKEEEATESIKFQIPEYAPLSVDEIVYDFDVVEKNEDKNVMNVSVSVLPKEIVSQYLSLCRESSLVPLSFEIETQATSRALIEEGDKKTHVIVDIGKTRTGISIVTGPVVRFTSTVELGGDVVTEAIKKHFGVSFEKADAMKQEKGFTKTRDDSDLYSAIAISLSALKDEIEKRILFWEDSKTSGRANSEIQSIILCGGNASIPGLREYLETCFSKTVVLGNVWVNIFSIDTHVPPIDFKHSLTYPTAIGLAISSE